MKLSFSLPSKASSKSNPIKSSKNFGDENKSSNVDDSRKYVTEFNANDTLPDGKKDVVIPPIQNEWRPHKKMKNLELPLQSDGSGGLQFEVEAPTSAEAEANNSKISYGLNLRQTNKEDEQTRDSESRPVGDDQPQFRPVEDVLIQKLRYDMERLPEHRGMEEFTDMPVENFAAALLSGYGWSKGMGIGKNTKEDVKIVEYTKKMGKHGIGFTSNDAPVPDSDSGLKSNKREKEKVRGVDRDNGKGGVSVGKEVRIVWGREVGMKGRIVEKLGNNKLVVRLSRSEEPVEVLVSDVAELGSREEETCLKRLKEMKLLDEAEKKASKRVREEGRKQNSSGGDSRRESQKKSGQVSWLTSHIRVRIISRDLKGERLYLKKGEVVDVVGPNMCDICMDENRELIQGVAQDLLETVLPRRGGPVLVLSGKHKGVYGSLVEKDLDQDTGVVRDADSHALLNVRLEQIAEYIGDPSYLGY
ncbi:hypothetical protein UlMin_022940 [Ulmus minor]